MHAYVSKIGRMKYLRPCYIALVTYGRRDLAYKWFIENQSFYHPIAVAVMRKIILQQVTQEEEVLLERMRMAL